MRRSLKTLLSVTAAVGALTGAPALYAHADTGNQERSAGMMRDGQGAMMGMMNMMGQMMENCSKMMQSMHHGGSEKPNEQRREKNAPETGNALEKNG